MSPRTRVLGATGIVLLLGGAWWFFRGSDGSTVALAASGTVEATEADLGFQIPGRIDAVRVREGDDVGAGDELAVLDLEEIRAREGAAQASLEAARALLRELRSGSRPEEIARARAALRAAEEGLAQEERDLERARTLFQGGAISQEALERARTARELAAADVEQAAEGLRLVTEGPRAERIQAQEAGVRQAESALAQVRAALRNGVVTAPFAGRVTERHREPGETVAAGQPVLTVRDLSDRWVRIYIPEDRIGRVSVGQRAEITTDSYPERAYGGRVFFIGSEAEFTPRNVQTAEERTRLVYPVKVRIADDPELDLKPGIPADVRLLEPGT